MSYYILKPAVDTQETGNAYPAVESYDDYDFNAPNSVYKLNFHEFPDFTPDIRFKLAKGAKLCDMMGQATINANGFLISEKLKSIFEKANIIPHKFYLASIEANSSLYNYYWFHLIWNEGIELVDFTQTLFEYKISNSEKTTCLLANYSEYVEKKKSLGFFNPLRAVKITLRRNNFDLIINPLSNSVLINKNLKDEITTHSLSGINCKEEIEISFN
jgi:hypothetical protein